ncbi:hypothetical protein BS47DRAFT_1362768 [Hydnum rufescens UP504]|uniref:Uncharacterized protein n=1 Tax=Hydnum rufescens UP504 TaxID=1448309 RepID=A0A9P6AW23_9AGAM|nr:hypothetical protein BS47DRAFT_1362768 [Hydnum rufescens UP504]
MTLNAFINLIRVSSAEDPESQALIHKLTVRDKDLGAWASQPSPLDFGVSTHAALIHLLNFYHTFLLLSLPSPKGKDITATELAIQLDDLAGPGHEHRWIIAPFDPKGTAHPVFMITFECQALLSLSTSKDKKDCSTQIPAGCGAPIRQPVWDSRISLGRATDSKHVVPSHTLTLDEHFIVASQHGQDAAECNHVDAPWDAKDTVLQDLSLLVTCLTLHKEWHIPSCSSGQICPGSKDIAFTQKANYKGYHEQDVLLTMWTILIVALSAPTLPRIKSWA